MIFQSTRARHRRRTTRDAPPSWLSLTLRKRGEDTRGVNPPPPVTAVYCHFDPILSTAARGNRAIPPPLFYNLEPEIFARCSPPFFSTVCMYGAFYFRDKASGWKLFVYTRRTFSRSNRLESDNRIVPF